MGEDFFIQDDGPRLAVRDYGGEGPPIVLVHGGYGNLGSFDQLGPLLARNLRTVAYDQRGHGWSQSGPIGVAEFVLDLAAVIRVLQLERPIIYGGSFGTLVGLAYLLEGGATRGFITEDGRLIDFPAVLGDEDPPPDSARLLSHEDWRTYAARFDAAGPAGQTTAARSAVRRPDEVMELRPSPLDVFTKLRAFARLPVRAAYRSTAVPVMALLAGQGIDRPSREAEVEDLAAEVDLDAFWFDTGHWISAAATESVAEEVLRFAADLV